MKSITINYVSVSLRKKITLQFRIFFMEIIINCKNEKHETDYVSINN